MLRQICIKTGNGDNFFASWFDYPRTVHGYWSPDYTSVVIMGHGYSAIYGKLDILELDVGFNHLLFFQFTDATLCTVAQFQARLGIYYVKMKLLNCKEIFLFLARCRNGEVIHSYVPP